MKKLLKRFHLNGHTIGFHPQTLKLVLHTKCKEPCESIVEEVSFEESHQKFWSTESKVRITSQDSLYIFCEWNQGRFSFVRTGRPHPSFSKLMDFYREICLKNHLLRAYFFEFDWSRARQFWLNVKCSHYDENGLTSQSRSVPTHEVLSSDEKNRAQPETYITQ